MGESFPNLNNLLIDARSAIDVLLSNLSEQKPGQLHNLLAEPSDVRAIGKHYLSVLKSRDRLLGRQLSDSAWVILIDLYVHEQNRNISVSSACVASGRPPTTALRQIRVLCEFGLIDRQHDPRDGKIVYLKLTETARKAVEEHLIELTSASQ